MSGLNELRGQRVAFVVDSKVIDGGVDVDAEERGGSITITTQNPEFSDRARRAANAARRALEELR